VVKNRKINKQCFPQPYVQQKPSHTDQVNINIFVSKTFNFQHIRVALNNLFKERYEKCTVPEKS